MEKNPLRGTLAKNMTEAPNKEGLEKPILRGTLAPRAEVSAPTKQEGKTVSKEQLPDIRSLASLAGRTVVQRDGGKRCTFTEIKDSEHGSFNRKIIRLIGEDNMRYSLPAEGFLASITTEGGAWRLLE